MRVLLAVDGSACSEAAVEMVADRFRPEGTHVKVIHAVEWMREMPLCFQYAHGISAGEDVAECRNSSFERARLLVGRIAYRPRDRHPCGPRVDSDRRRARRVDRVSAGRTRHRRDRRAAPRRGRVRAHYQPVEIFRPHGRCDRIVRCGHHVGVCHCDRRCRRRVCDHGSCESLPMADELTQEIRYASTAGC